MQNNGRDVGRAEMYENDDDANVPALSQLGKEIRQ